MSHLVIKYYLEIQTWEASKSKVENKSLNEWLAAFEPRAVKFDIVQLRAHQTEGRGNEGLQIKNC